MEWGQGIVLLLHIVAGAAWLGASIFANAVLLPYVSLQPIDRHRELIGSLILGPERVIIGGALVAAVTGVALGIGYNGIRSITAFATPYGLVWLASVAVAIGVFAVGGGVTSPAARALRDDPSLWDPDVPDADDRRASLMDRLRLGFRLELVGIVFVLGLMVILGGI